MLDELYELFDRLNESLNLIETRKIVEAYIGSVPWDNYYDDEKGRYFTLGEVWYCRMQWFKETDSKELLDFVEKNEDILPSVLNEFEKMVQLSDPLEPYFELQSFYGNLHVSKKSGHVLRWNLFNTNDPGFLDKVDIIDVVEYLKYYNKTELPSIGDIRDFGFWNNGEYEKPDEEWRLLHKQ